MLERLGKRVATKRDAMGDATAAKAMNIVIIPGLKDKRGDLVDGTDITTQASLNRKGTPFFYAAWELYCNFKRFGLPHGSGSLKERPLVLNLISLFDGEVNETQDWKMKNSKFMD